MGGRGSSFTGSRSPGGGANFKTVQDAQLALTKEGFFDQYAALVKYDWRNPNDTTGTPVVDIKTANAIYDTIHKLSTEFPELKGIARSMSPETMGAHTYAHCHMLTGEININPNFWKSWEKISGSYERDVKSGWHPQGTVDPTAIIVHEFGHAVDGWLSYRKGLFGYTPKGDTKYASSVLRPKVMKAAGLKVSDTSTAVSQYAAKDAKEWFAECFTEYVCSPNPRPVAAEFGKQLKALIKQAAAKP